MGGTMRALSCGYKILVYNVFTRSQHARISRLTNRTAITALRFVEETVASLIMRYGKRDFAFPDSSARMRSLDEAAGMKVKRLLVKALSEDSPNIIFVPMGIAMHPDHIFLFNLLFSLFKSGKFAHSTFKFYKDMPYAARSRPENRVEEIQSTMSVKLAPSTVNVSNHFKFKMRVASIYRSQFDKRDLAKISEYALGKSFRS